LHVIDLNAAKGEGDNINIITNLIKEKQCPIEIGGGY